MTTLKLTQIGNSLGVILPKELLGKFKLEKGDELIVSESPDGFNLIPHDSEFEKELKAAEKIMRKRRNVLRELAK
ncbi:AbrB/MazE/SpoVT family DNA-binding domain-containing protein [Pseudomethylobacillus aquaticus]|uniref:AbrB/MazE/SpoVT family DNA-binding domain-containing protein n=1 Tax=Pseudomethylobacillus aquaticus TaxID=2676064 RepID=A0A3N0V330_9PROT|nr:AbrB/MazE/SpoVT family DNA-binding domain-containing protein [Pseudomethylobacillus aquaticus]ROH87002.1 AbrB/MazE/SpoVT family DNA-binding domain-containing protein [Pseudomethylobacillus aquaticus]